MGLQAQAAQPAKHFPPLKTVVQLFQEVPGHSCSVEVVC